MTMKRKRYTEPQIVFVLQQAEVGTPVAEVCRKMGVVEATFYRWKKRYGGLGVSEIRRLRQLEDENRLLTIVDNYSRESLARKVGLRLSGADVVEVLNDLIGQRGIPHSLRVDNGPQFTSRVLDQWAYYNGVVLDFIRPGKPTDNAVMEAFNSRFRQECLNEHWFVSVADAQVRVELWRKHYNGERPHSCLENLTPEQFANQSIAGHPLGDGQTATQPPATTCQPDDEFCLV